jgi:membrane fusion protein (multidrug efflux system)
MPGKLRASFLRPILLVVIPLAAILFALQWYARGARYAETDNAYVKAQVIPISAEVSGRVIEVAVKDQQRVPRGTLLFRLDPAPFQLSLARADAQLSVVRTEIETLRAEFRSARTDAEEQSARIPFLERQLERQARMKEKGMSREDLYDEAQNNLETAKKRLAALRERAARALAALDGKPEAPAESHPRYRQALAMRDTAQLDLERTRVAAPAPGTVSNLKMRPGEFVEHGAAKFSLVDDGPPWVEANYKETQLTDMREGQAAQFTADAYPGVSWKARVTTIGAATGAEFAVLPPQNATGNWVKVVQRIPVRIAIEETGERPPLRAGMTVTVSVDTGRERGAFDLVREFFSPARASAGK